MRIGSLVAKGAATFEVGSAGAPSITFTGSTTAGFFAPSAGQVAIAAGAGVNVFEIEGGGTPGKITLTTGYDSLLPVAGSPGDDNAIVTKKWAEDNFVIGSISTLALNDLTDVTITGVATNDFLVNNGAGQFINQVPATARTSLGVAIGSDVQAWDAQLDDISGLSPTANNFIVGDGGNWTQETPAEARTSLDLDAGGAGDIWVEKAGDSMDSGANIVFQGNGEVRGLPGAPLTAGSAASKAYVDAAITGLNWIDPVFYLDLIDDSFCVNVNKDLQNQSNDTDSQITSVEDSDMLIVGNGFIAQGLTWTATGVTGNIVNTTGLMPGDVMRWDSDSANGFLNPSWEKVQFDEGGPNIAVLVFRDETVAGLHGSDARWGNGIVTNANKGGSFFGFSNNIWDLVIDDASEGSNTVILTNSANGAVTASADGGTGFTITQVQAGSASLPEITSIDPSAGASGLATSGSADYWTFDTVGANNYYVWYNPVGGTATDPNPGGTGIEVSVESSDGFVAVSSKTRGAISAVVGFTNGTNEAFVNGNYEAWWAIAEGFGVEESNAITVETQANISDSDFFYLTSSVQAPLQTATLTITNTSNGAAADTVDGATATNFKFTKLIDGSGGSAEQTEILFNGARSFPDSGTGPFFDFTDHTATTYRVWFDKDNGNTAPGVTTEVLIEVDISANFCASSTSLAARAAINGSAANTNATTTADRMFGDNSADGGLRFHVWFDKSGSAVDPAPIDSYEGIEVDISTATTQNDVALAIKTALDAHRPQVGGAAIGVTVLWDTSVVTTDITIANTHAGRGTAPAPGTGTSGGTWAYSVGGRTQGTFTGPSNNDAFFVANPDSFNAGNQYVYSSSNMSWTQFGGATTILPGTGLSQSGQFFNVNLGPGIFENPSDEVSLEFFTTTTGAIILTSDGTTRDFNNINSKLQLLIDGSTLTQGAAGLKVPSQGITETELNLTVAGDGISGGNGTALAVDGGNGITLSGGQAIVDATSTFTFPGGQLEIQASSVTDAMLATDYVQVAGDTMTGDLTMGSGAQIFLAGDGTKTDPGLAVAGDTDTGIFSVGTNQLGVSAGDTLTTTFATTDVSFAVPVLNAAGGVGAPSVSFSGDTDTGMWSSAGDTIDFSTGGAERITINPNGLMTTGATTGAAYTALVNAGGDEAIVNKGWVSSQLGSLSTTTIVDADADTKVSVEESADDDTIRMDAGETPAGYGAVADIFVLNSSAWTVAMGTANVATTVGAPISVTAGIGNTSGNGGVVNVTAGQGGSTGTGGAITVTGGAGGATSGYGGNAILQGGHATGTGGGGNANVYAGNGNSVGGSVNLQAGASSGSDQGGTVSINAGQGGPTGDGGAMALYAGNAGATSGEGGYIQLYAGAGGGASDNGGDIRVYGGNSGGASGQGGEVNLTGGSGGTGYGGDANLNGGNSTLTAGRGTVRGGTSTTGDGGTARLIGGNGNSGSSLGGSVSLLAGDATSNVGGNLLLEVGDGSSDANDGFLQVISQYNEFRPKSTTTGAELRLREGTGNGADYIGHKAPDAITSTVTYTWPEAPAANGYALISQTDGTMSWLNLGTGLDNSKITDGDATTAETYIDTNESADTITSQIGLTGNYPAFEPLNVSAGATGTAIKAATATGGGDSGRPVTIDSGAGNAAGDGGGVTITTGNGGTSGNGGTVSIQPGDSGASAGNGGGIELYAGDTTLGVVGGVKLKSGIRGNYGSSLLTVSKVISLTSASGTSGGEGGGGINITAGTGDGGGGGGDLTLQAGSSTSGASGNVLIKAGNSATPGYIELDTVDTAEAVELRFKEASVNGANYIGLRAPNGVSTSRTIVLPQNDDSNNDVLTTDGAGNTSWGDLATLAGSTIAFGDLSDILDTVAQTDQVVSVLVGNGTQKETQSLIGGTNLTQVVDQGADTVTLNVDDVFIANQGGDSFGDTGAGVWTVVSGSRIDAATGAVMRMADLPTSGTDLVNKNYADSIAAGLDPKESVLVATTADLTGVTWGSPSYNYTAGTGGTGAFVDINLSAAVDGVTLQISDRVLVKDQSNAKQNGLYIVRSGTSFPTQALLERSPDHDGSPTNEVSGGNFTFVEDGTAQDTGWVLTGQGILTLSTNGTNGDDLVWTQFSGAGSFTAGIGLSQSGNDLDLNLDDLTTASIVSTDTIAFHDADGTPAASGSITRKLTASSFISDLNILTDSNIVAQDGVRFDSGTNTFEMDITNLGAATIVGADELVFDDGASGNHAKTTVTNFLSDLNIANRAYTSSGFMTHTADDTWGAVTIGASTVNDKLGISVPTGDGTVNVAVGLDIVGLTPLGTAPADDDSLVIYDLSGTVNRKVTIDNVADAIAATINIGDLADVVADSTADAAGNMLVADGVDSYDTKKVQHIETVTAQTSVIVSHNLSQQFVIVQCYDTTGASPVMIIPQSVTLTNANTTTVAFSPAFTGKIVIMGVTGVV